MPVVNLASDLWKPWRTSPGVTQANVFADFDSEQQDVNLVAISGHNLTQAATWNVSVYGGLLYSANGSFAADDYLISGSGIAQVLPEKIACSAFTGSITPKHGGTGKLCAKIRVSNVAGTIGLRSPDRYVFYPVSSDGAVLNNFTGEITEMYVRPEVDYMGSQLALGPLRIDGGYLTNRQLREYPRSSYWAMSERRRIESIWIRLEDPGNPAGYIQVQNLFAGYAWDRPMQYGSSLGIVDPQRWKVLPSGVVSRTKAGIPRRRVKAEIAKVPTREALEQIIQILWRANTSRPIFFAGKPEEDHGIRALTSFLGRLKSMPTKKHAGYHDWRSSFEIEEINIGNFYG